MAVGKPIAAYDLAESRYTAGEAAIYVPSGNMEAYADAIVGLLDDPGQRALMGELGIERIKTRFQWERQKENLLRAYARVMHKGRGGA
jgi:glycosyltransferase involved in cell wall biosynthesis